MAAAAESSMRFSGHTLDKATKAKVTLENYYSNLIAQHMERKQRYVYYVQNIRVIITEQVRKCFAIVNTRGFIKKELEVNFYKA